MSEIQLYDECDYRGKLFLRLSGQTGGNVNIDGNTIKSIKIPTDYIVYLNEKDKKVKLFQNAPCIEQQGSNKVLSVSYQNITNQILLYEKCNYQGTFITEQDVNSETNTIQIEMGQASNITAVKIKPFRSIKIPQSKKYEIQLFNIDRKVISAFTDSKECIDDKLYNEIVYIRIFTTANNSNTSNTKVDTSNNHEWIKIAFIVITIIMVLMVLILLFMYAYYTSSQK